MKREPNDKSWNIHESDLVLGKQIGSGAYAEVLEATLKTKDGTYKKVAAKRLYSNICSPTMTQVMEENQNELTIQCQLEHKNIVTFLGVVLTGTTMILVSELAAKGSLYDFLRRRNNNPLSERRFHKWILQAASSIQYLQEHGIVHRDIKSLNYLVTEDNTLKLCDFGIAKMITHTVDSIQKGSFPWMAPEVFIEQKVSLKSDIYSYGIVVWEMKTGRVPFEGMEAGAIMWAVGHDKRRPEIPDDCPQPIRSLLCKCWAADRRDRPSIDCIVADIKKMINLLRLEKRISLH